MGHGKESIERPQTIHVHHALSGQFQPTVAANACQTRMGPVCLSAHQYVVLIMSAALSTLSFSFSTLIPLLASSTSSGHSGEEGTRTPTSTHQSRGQNTHIDNPDTIQHAYTPCPGGVSTVARARACSTDCSASPILSLPPSERMRYRASVGEQATKRPLMMSIFLVCDCGRRRAMMHSHVAQQ